MAASTTPPADAERRRSGGSLSEKHRRFSSGQVAPQGNFQLTRADLDDMNRDQMTAENLRHLQQTGGVVEVARRLGVDIKVGLTSEEAASGFTSRVASYGENRYPEPPMTGFWMLFWESFKDPVLIILIMAAVVSLIVGFLEDPEKGWVDGVAILIAVLLVAFVTAGNDYSKEQQFRALNAVKEAIDVKVVRDGKEQAVSTHDLQVGEVCVLETGDKIPADCIFIRGDDVESNESSLTGEPEDIKKNADKDPFLLSGCQITAGRCRALIIAVGVSSRWGRIKDRLATEAENTPLQDKLDIMVTQIGYVGAAVGLLTAIVMVIMWFAVPETQEQARNLEAWIIHAFIVCVTILVVAIPEGLPLAVTISLAYSTKKMLSDNNLIRVLAACETMGNATNICSDKTGTLTENRMTVVEGVFASKHYSQEQGVPSSSMLPKELVEILQEGIAVNSTASLTMNEGDKRPAVLGSKTEGALLIMIENWGARYVSIREEVSKKKLYTFSSARKMMSALVSRPDGTYRLYVKGASEIVLNRCTQMLREDGSTSAITPDDRTDASDSILGMARGALRTIGLAHRDFTPETLPETWDSTPPESELVLDAIVGIEDPLRPDVKEAVRTCQKAGIMVRMVTGDNIDTAQAIARKCCILTPSGEALEGPSFREMTPEQLDNLLPRLQVLARSSPDDKHTLVVRLNGQKLPKDEKAWREMHPGCDFETLKDQLLPGYRDEWLVARKSSNGTDGEVVGVTGDGTNDAPALKAADVGLSMGISGTEVAKEASDIVIMDDRFSSIVQAVLWGRSVYDNIRKFLQFQLTVNVVALLATFISAVVGYDPPLNPVMMLWVNLIMDTMGALALGTEAPTLDLLNRRPYRRTAGLVDRVMWRNILVQSAFQLALLLIMLTTGGSSYVTETEGEDPVFVEGWLGADVLDGKSRPCLLDPSDAAAKHSNYADLLAAQRTDDEGRKVCDHGHDTTHFTMIFNAFVWCQIFNEFNARRINSDWRVFAGMSTNWMFLGVIIISGAVQAFMVEVGGDFTKTTSLSGTNWLITIGLATITLPLGFVMRFLRFQFLENPSDFGGYPDPMEEVGDQTDAVSVSADTKVAAGAKAGGGDSEQKELAG